MDKPKVEDLLDYLKVQIPNCSITQAEIDDLNSLYPNIAYKDLNRVFHQAIKQHCIQPVSYITRQLRVIRPAADPFNSQISKSTKRGFSSSKSVETGTDWAAVELKRQSKREQLMANYNQVHGAGAFEQKEQEDYQKIHQFFVDFEKEYMGEKQ
ncbi:MAG: hypothetical protein J6565_03125 [Lactobacillus sp.]|nr:hypothetical protein [Lactobacillus sp.]